MAGPLLHGASTLPRPRSANPGRPTSCRSRVRWDQTPLCQISRGSRAGRSFPLMGASMERSTRSCTSHALAVEILSSPYPQDAFIRPGSLLAIWERPDGLARSRLTGSTQAAGTHMPCAALLNEARGKTSRPDWQSAFRWTRQLGYTGSSLLLLPGTSWPRHSHPSRFVTPHAHYAVHNPRPTDPLLQFPRPSTSAMTMRWPPPS